MADTCMRTSRETRMTTDPSAVPPEQRATYAAMIDGILKDADLEQISAKAIRNAMQQRISYDITPQKVG